MQAVNLLPSEQRPARPAASAAAADAREAPIGALAVLAILAVAVIAVALHVQGTNTVKDREAELASVTAQVQVVSARAAKLQRYTAFEALATQRQQTVGALARGRFDWAPTLTDIARVLPGDAYLGTLCGDAGAGGCTATLRSGLPNATAVTMTGCTTSQDAVATLMTRLRNVRGVTRVTLESSMRATTGADATDSATPGTRPCPKGDPPQFSLVVFFGRAPIAAAGQANAVATPTPAATPAAGATATPTPATPAAGTTAGQPAPTATAAAATPASTP